ncbi:hypothetical protein ABJ851_001067 [Shigella flexneri]|nr:hypothetical protein [Escherichia coli]
MIKDRIQEAVDARLVLGDEHFVPEPPVSKFDGRIPTLEKNVWRQASPQLQARFTCCGRWVSATHGTWLSIQDMETLWSDEISEQLLDVMKYNAQASRDNWNDHAWGLFRSSRLSLFAGSDSGYEAIFLLWLDNTDEPELWVYDCNGESRYKNLDDYLLAYINDDLSASERSWRAE